MRTMPIPSVCYWQRQKIHHLASSSKISSYVIPWALCYRLLFWMFCYIITSHYYVHSPRVCVLLRKTGLMTYFSTSLVKFSSCIFQALRFLCDCFFAFFCIGNLLSWSDSRDSLTIFPRLCTIYNRGGLWYILKLSWCYLIHLSQRALRLSLYFLP